jgi:hypothetical protein
MRPAEVGLDLVQSGLELPSLGVESGQLVSGGLCWVEDRGDEPVDAVVARDGVLDRPYPHTIAGVMDVALVEDLGQVGTVR